MRKIYLVHGYTASSRSHWFPWLQKRIGQRLICAQMPDPSHPKLQNWLDHLDNLIDDHQKMILIGHSLGCVTILRYLQNHELENVDLILVSAFADKVANLPELNEFVEKDLDFDDLKRKINKAYIISARNDQEVDYRHSDRLAQKLSCPFILMPDGGHFMASDGIKEFPLVLNLVRELSD
ncbi:RBBP9/YdeN family alpha/beta hydrolase [Oenococcus alcoholitolerans]|uniref:Esterase n=1 Tax=Oenococcus alcoholitolerans TaxID=931074 RepID=A0ABR4XPH6_9LACO|nr:hypothetical protein Q757_07795 [Oenococcus alcoholitolerans]